MIGYRLAVILGSFLLIVLQSTVVAQKKDEKFKISKVTVEDLQKKTYLVDSSASAVVLFDIGTTEFVGDNKGGLSIKFTRLKRVHILNKAAYEKADVFIYLYHSPNFEAQEKLENAEGITYNVENNKLTTIKLERRKGIFTEKISDNVIAEKFTMPNVKEGSIIDYEYTIVSDYIAELKDWIFQGKYPVLWSEYNVTMPGVYNYARLTQGFIPYYINKHSEGMFSYSLHNDGGTTRNQNGTLTCNNLYSKYVMKDVPALKNKPFISTLKNYAAKISFQLKAVERNGRLKP